MSNVNGINVEYIEKTVTFKIADSQSLTRYDPVYLSSGKVAKLNGGTAGVVGTTIIGFANATKSMGVLSTVGQQEYVAVIKKGKLPFTGLMDGTYTSAISIGSKVSLYANGSGSYFVVANATNPIGVVVDGSMDTTGSSTTIIVDVDLEAENLLASEFAYPIDMSVAPTGGAVAANALLMGVGTSASPASTSSAGKYFMEYRCQTKATSGDNRLLYMRYDVNGANASGSAECLRAFTKLTAAVGTARGCQISLDVDTTGSISGLGAGVDAQLYLPGAAVSAGTWGVLNAEIYTVASTTVSARMSFLRCVVSGDNTAIGNVDDNAYFAEFAGMTAGSGNIIDTSKTTHTAYGGLRVYIPGVGTRWIALVSA